MRINVESLARAVVVALALAGVAACGGDDPATSDASIGTDAPPGADASSTTRADVTFNAGSVALTGYVTTSPASPAGSPGVLLIHQFQQNDEQWGDLPEVLAARGYRVLAFNLRGHGDSDPYGGSALSGILSDPVAAPADTDAALAYLTSTGEADPARIAIIGTSIGANLTVRAAINGDAKTYVSLSSRKSAVETFAGTAATGMNSVFYLAGENDSGGVQARDAQTMYGATQTPREVKIYAGSSAHGSAILSQHEDARGLVLDWISANL